MATKPNAGGASALPFIHPDDMPDVYAMPGVGTCMEPLLSDGSTLAFDKREQPKRGDVVGVILTREAAQRRGVPGLVKRLVYNLPPPGFAGLIVVEQTNPPRQYSIPTTDVLGVHKFIGIAESDGNGGARIRRDLLPEGR